MQIRPWTFLQNNQGIRIDDSYPEIMTYLIRHAGTDRYKIGASHNPFRRLSRFRISNLDLMLVTYGNKIKEKELHKKYEANRIELEWFKLSIEQADECIKLIGNPPKFHHEKRLLKMRDLVHRFNLAETTVRRATKSNSLKHVVLPSGHRRFYEEDVEEWIRNRNHVKTNC